VSAALVLARSLADGVRHSAGALLAHLEGHVEVLLGHREEPFVTTRCNESGGTLRMKEESSGLPTSTLGNARP
jgi:hypothetical protein